MEFCEELDEDDFPRDVSWVALAALVDGDLQVFGAEEARLVLAGGNPARVRRVGRFGSG